MQKECEQTYVGKWWLPHRPMQIVHGSLEIEESYPELSVYESLSLDQDSVADDRRQFVIHGRSMGVGVTLLDSQHTSRNRVICDDGQGPYEENQHKFVAAMALIGDELLAEDECIFNRAAFRLYNLDQWINRTMYRNSDRLVEALNLPDLTAEIPGCQISVRRVTTSHHGRLTDAGFTSHELIELELEERVTVEDLHQKFIRPLEQLLTLATGQHCESFALKVGNYDERKEWLDTWPIKAHHVRHKRHDQAQPGKPMARERMRFGMNSKHNPPNVEFSGLVPKWYERQAELSSACDWVFSLHSDVGGYLQQQVFTIASAIEALHRGLNPQYEERTEADRARNKAILAIVKKEYPEHHSWLAGAIQYSHRKTYMFRGRELLQYTENVMTEIVGNEENWIQEIRKIRDGIGHVLDSNDEYNAKSMVALLRTARLFAEVVLLRQLGFSTEECRQALRHSWELQNAQQRMRDSFPEWFAAAD
ncbi:HEPN domain-containing protein [Streptomyces sp. NPDC047829]|uniref:ApeA N-terminal domain 1-containing protein n=1 Tax=Streptomyces sp. NPDC047829 TaxID=3154609 RepID=UPI0033EEA18F